ncbi:MAG: DUF4145 domain-containing protein [Gemmatimonadota bacterium]|nr:MAG: DUF4145 domain-containing protein [Gemmatimonadota bacterium]
MREAIDYNGGLLGDATTPISDEKYAEDGIAEVFYLPQRLDEAYAEGLRWQIDSAIRRFGEARRLDWEGRQLEIAGNTISGEKVLKLVDSLAEEIVSTSEELMGGFDTVSLGDMVELFELQGVKQKIELDLARASLESLDDQVLRYRDLVGLTMPHEPGHPVRKFLRRVSRCYIAGLFSEVVILCRAVLENALREKCISSDLLPETDRGQTELSAMIGVARLAKWLSDQSVTRAMTIRDRGNKAVHYDPEVTRGEGVRETLQWTMGLLSELYGAV